MRAGAPGAFAQRGCDAEQASELDKTEEVLRVELPTDQQMALPLNPGKEAFDRSQLLRAFPGHKTRLSRPQDLTAWPERDDSNY
jgi:hypothetical protein